MTHDEIIYTQQVVGTDPDGFWGRLSTTAAQQYLRDMMPSPNPWPKADSASLFQFYGAPGDEDQLTSLVAPVPMFYEGKAIKTIRCHHKVANSLARALRTAYAVAPLVVKVYDGCYNDRNMRGSSAKSLHAWGAAIDLDAEHNGNHVHWPVAAEMSIDVMAAFAREGWLSAGAFWSRDGMHFQATQ